MSDDLAEQDKAWQEYQHYLLGHVRPTRSRIVRLSYADLVAWGACDLREQFRADFPDGLAAPGPNVAAWLALLDRGYARGLGFPYSQTLDPSWRVRLCGADLRRYDFSEAELMGADLGGADLRGVNLRGAMLGAARLYRADLRGADLRGAFLKRANLFGARMDEAPAE